MSYGRHIQMSSSNMAQRKDAVNRIIRSGHSNVAVDFVCLLSCVVSGVFILSSKAQHIKSMVDRIIRPKLVFDLCVC